MPGKSREAWQRSRARPTRMVGCSLSRPATTSRAKSSDLITCVVSLLSHNWSAKRPPLISDSTFGWDDLEYPHVGLTELKAQRRLRMFCICLAGTDAIVTLTHMSSCDKVASMERDLLAQPLRLPFGAVIRRRLAKGATSEGLATPDGLPTDALAQLYPARPRQRLACRPSRRGWQPHLSRAVVSGR